MVQSSPLLNTIEAGRYLRLSSRTLENLRVRGGGPAFTKLGRRRCFYTQTALDEWIAAQSRTSTSDAGRAA